MLRLRGKEGTQLGTIFTLGVRSFVAASTGGSLTFVLGSEWGGNGGTCFCIGYVLLRASEQAAAAAKRFGGTVFCAIMCCSAPVAAGLKRTEPKLVLRSPTKRVWGELFFLDVYRNAASYTSNLKCASGLRRLRQPFALILSTRTRCWLRTDIHDDEPGWIYIDTRRSPSAFLLVVGHFPSFGETDAILKIS